MEFENITMIMMELYHQLKNRQIDRETAEYFIIKLDDIRNNIAYSQYFPNVQNISDAVASETNYIDLVYGNKQIDGRHFTEVVENERGKIVKNTFFKENGDGSIDYLGNHVKLSVITESRLLTFIKHGLLSPHVFDYDITMGFLDRKRFKDISEQGMLDYKKYIDELVACQVILSNAKSAEQKEELTNELFLEWTKTMEKRCLSHRVDVYERAREIEKAQREYRRSLIDEDDDERE